MGIDENKRIVEEFMRRFSAGELDDAFTMLDDDMTWWLWGTTPIAATYDKAGMLTLLQQSAVWFASTPAWTPTRYTAEDDRVAVEATSDAITRGGYHHHGTYHNLFRLKGGKIVEIREMFLEGAVQKLLAAMEAEQRAK